MVIGPLNDHTYCAQSAFIHLRAVRLFMASLTSHSATVFSKVFCRFPTIIIIIVCRPLYRSTYAQVGRFPQSSSSNSFSEPLVQETLSL